MCLMRSSRRRSFYVHCPVCSKELHKSEKESNTLKCTRCGTRLRISLIPGLLLIRFDGKMLKSPDYDGAPEHDRRRHDKVAFSYD